jgi:hypothetical protein
MSKSSEMHAHHLLNGSCSETVCGTLTDCESNASPTGTRAFEKQLCVSAAKLQTRGSFTMTTRQVTHHLLPTHHPALTWLCVTCFYSRSSKDIIFGQLKTSRQL